MIAVSVCQSQSKLHSVHPPPILNAGVGGGLGVGRASNQILKSWGLDRTSTFRGGLMGKKGKKGVTFFGGGGGGVQLLHNKLKSEIFDDKKSL